MISSTSLIQITLLLWKKINWKNFTSWLRIVITKNIMISKIWNSLILRWLEVQSQKLLHLLSQMYQLICEHITPQEHHEFHSLQMTLLQSAMKKLKKNKKKSSYTTPLETVSGKYFQVHTNRNFYETRK